ncbi:MAG: N-acetylmuramoyl-L-alanine amidase [Aestuariivirga sp.]
MPTPDHGHLEYSLQWLPSVLRKAGLKVVEQPQWQTRGHGEIGPIKMIVCHHTADNARSNAPSLGEVTNGRSDLAGPLAQLVLGRDGTFFVICAGKAWHAGSGSWKGITAGNECAIGIEAENSGYTKGPNAEAWSEVQLTAYAKGCAALADYAKIKTNMVIGHKEWAPKRKVDPTFDMNAFRTRVDTFRKPAAVAST